MAKSTVVYSFAFLGLVTLAFILFPGARPQENANTTQPGWEYKVMDFDSGQCTAASLESSLNESGKAGWELLAYSRFATEDEILVRPASTGYGKEVSPPLTDSFQGTITNGVRGKCRVVLKRPR